MEMVSVTTVDRNQSHIVLNCSHFPKIGSFVSLSVFAFAPVGKARSSENTL